MSEDRATSDATPRANANISDRSKRPAQSTYDDARPSASASASRRNLSSSASASMRRLSASGRSIHRRTSEMLSSTLKMFRRTGGKSGASVEMLRGESGSDFEGYATVHRGGGGMTGLFSCCLGGSSGEKHVYLLIKGYHCFVYDDENGIAPKYAIELIHRKAVIVPTSHDSFVPRVPHPGANRDANYATVHLESGLGDVEYRITLLSDPRERPPANDRHQGGGGGIPKKSVDGDATAWSPATRFVSAVTRASSEASTDEVRTRLGHGGLLNRRASVKFAQEIGNAKAKDQPDAPVSASEIMAGMPVTPIGYG